jgi:N-acetylglucosaminyldiphosphoundecaprenol N-acetyl-beta-D-mannosaminyltransferase
MRRAIGPLEIDIVPRDLLIEDLLAEALTGGSTRLVVTANAQFYVLAETSFIFRECLKRAETVCADGVSIALATAILSKEKVERLAGVDLVEEICRRGALRGLRVFLLGGRPGSALGLAEILRKRYPGLEVVGTLCPDLGFEKSESELTRVLEHVRSTQPHVIFVALGAPKQELFIDQHLRRLKIPIAVGVGGSFEIITGVTRRAPRTVQRVGLEWLYRLIQEPQRLWRRYLLGNPKFLWLLTCYWLQMRKRELSGT